MRISCEHRRPARGQAQRSRGRHGRRGERRAACAADGSSPAARSPTTCAPCTKAGGREADDFYRDRWSHDKVVRSTHGVNCTGSCSWKVYVKDGIITWETQQTDYPSVGPDSPGVRAPRLPARRGVLLVHLLADPGPLPLRPRRAAADVPRGQVPARRRPGEGVGAHRRQPVAGQGLQVRSRQGRPGAGHLGGGHRARRGRPRAHDQEVRARPGGRLLADPGDVDGLARVGCPLRQPDRRLDAELLRLVRRPAGGLAAGVRRPDRRARVRRLVERRLPGHVGLEPARSPAPPTRTG